MKTIIFINSHPIQYFAPLYKYMNEQGLKTEAWYCSDESLKGGVDEHFGVNVKWDIPLLEGYDFRFFKNYAFKPSHFNGFFGLINLGLIKQLFTIPKSVIVAHGWHYCTHMLVILLAKLRGHVLCLRYEMPYNQEILRKGWKITLKKAVLKHIVFPRINLFLFIGIQNRLLYKSYGIDDKRLLFCPYSVDNGRFRIEMQKLQLSIPKIKAELGIPQAGKVILFSGKYIKKKRPLDILKAFIQLNNPDCWLIMVGEGELRQEMEEIIKKNNLKNVILTGFVNQSFISKYYVISDVFVMCSEIGETWGLSVNEAMNFNLPVIVSDLTGCSSDLVKDGVNGYIFKTGDVNDLTEKLRNVVVENKLTNNISSQSIINDYSFTTMINNITKQFN